MSKLTSALGVSKISGEVERGEQKKRRRGRGWDKGNLFALPLPPAHYVFALVRRVQKKGARALLSPKSRYELSLLMPYIFFYARYDNLVINEPDCHL